MSIDLITKLLLGITGITIPWDTLIGSVVLYIIIPLFIAMITRYIFLDNQEDKINKLTYFYSFLSFIGVGITLI